jgi:hypothetical protein
VAAITDVRSEMWGNPSGVTVAMIPIFSVGSRALMSASEKLFMVMIYSFL